MSNPIDVFRTAIRQVAGQWLATGLPSRQVLDEAAASLKRLRDQLAIRGLWQSPPCMVTATLDDGLGQGLAVIEAFAEAIGIQLIALGLMQPPAAIVTVCDREQADYLGLTILQFDSEPELTWIADNLADRTRIVAGGPVFQADPDFARRTGTHYAAKNVADFLWFMTNAVHKERRGT